MKEQARQKQCFAQSLPHSLLWASAGSVRWLTMFGKEAPSPMRASLGGADSIRPDGARCSKAVASHSWIGQVLQQVALVVSTEFSLEAPGILRSLFL